MWDKNGFHLGSLTGLDLSFIKDFEKIIDWLEELEKISLSDLNPCGPLTDLAKRLKGHVLTTKWDLFVSFAEMATKGAPLLKGKLSVVVAGTEAWSTTLPLLKIS